MASKREFVRQQRDQPMKSDSPAKYLTRRGRAYIEVSALKDSIEEWLRDGFNVMSIYKLLAAKKQISGTYGYRTFLRAVERVISDTNERVILLESDARAVLPGLSEEREASAPDSLIPFAFEDSLVRATADGQGNPWFVANDVCKVLGLANPRDAVSALDEDEKGVATTDTLGGQQKVLTISESGLYSLVFRSRKPQARSFRKWVTAEVLPTIRRTGRYEAPPEKILSPATPPLGLPEEACNLPPAIRVQVLTCAVEAAKLEDSGTGAIEGYFRRYCQLVAFSPDAQSAEESSNGDLQMNS
ncbi:TraK family protein [Fundidesulfovibrio putealis]|uniref:TraK family protein n=1 Tax=Fundidesulfovibrio putealis TaxID=270496 RepID=UPI002E211F7C